MNLCLLTIGILLILIIQAPNNGEESLSDSNLFTGTQLLL